MNETDYLKELAAKVKLREITWKQATELFNKKFNKNVKPGALSRRAQRMNATEREREYSETHNADGSIDIKTKIFSKEGESKTPETILKEFGYDMDSWEIQTWHFGKWEVAIKDEKENRICTTFRAVIKPKFKDGLTIPEMEKLVLESVKRTIKPIKLKPAVFNNTLDENLLIEFPATELHLGKLAWAGDTGQNYDFHIAKDRFYNIIQNVYETQVIHSASTLFMTIGNDFFNSDTTDNTTTKGTIQNNDLRWKKMFDIGLEMYKRAIFTLREMFNKIDVQLCQGNHDVMSSFYLYRALEQFFSRDERIHFSDNVRTTQCYQFGKVAIFTSHGDSNFKRLIKSIPAEFYKEWGTSEYRELHLGHLHKEVVVDDESGMITRRMGSPTGTDAWHYDSRFVGATQKQQLFIWHKDKGLLDIKYICFEKGE